MLIYLCQGDTKGSARGGDGSTRKETVGGQLGPSAQVRYQSTLVVSVLFLFATGCNVKSSICGSVD